MDDMAVIAVVDARVEEDQLMGDMVAVNVADVKVGVEEDQLMNDHVYFCTYYRLDFDHQF